MNDDRIKISVILPSLNVRPYIEQCLRSVIAQSYKNIEILCIDAGSDDGTFDVLNRYARYDKRIRVIVSEKRSYGYQVNLGIDKARGDFIGIVETDDYISQYFYEKLIDATDNDIDFVKSDAIGIKDCDGVVMKTKLVHVSDDELYNKKIIYPYVCQQTIYDPNIWDGIYRRKFIIDNNIRLSETTGAAYQDIGFKQQAYFSAKSCRFINDSSYNYRMNRRASSTFNIKCLNNAIYEYDKLLEQYNGSHYSCYLWECIIRSFLSESAEVLRQNGYCADDNIMVPYNWLIDKAKIYKADVDKALKEIGYNSLVLFDLLCRSLNSYIEYRHSVNRVEQRKADSIRRVADSRHLIVVGNGIRGKGLYQECFDYDIPVDAYADNDSTKWSDETNYSPEILSPENAVEKYSDDVFFIANKNHEEELRQQLLNLGVDESRIVIWHP